jgi:radical SAM/Cys-rich protein
VARDQLDQVDEVSSQAVLGELEHDDFDRSARAKRAANHAQKRLLVVGDTHVPENRFRSVLKSHGVELRKSKIDTLQVNVGKMCNLTCHHCHVEAGPDRTEMITPELVGALVSAAKSLGVNTVDMTGGAPEMCSGFKQYVQQFRSIGCKVMVRSNLTILVADGYEDFVDFFREQEIHVVASLPCYSQENVDKQRGDGVFNDSIKALKKLNSVGYGKAGSGLLLDLVYNPGGANLPGPQDALQEAYKDQLGRDFGIEFNTLYCITNLPIGRFYSDLKKAGKAEAYDDLLQSSFNLDTVEHLMCRNTLNVSWDGWVYDCDFNQMLELPAKSANKPVHICDTEAIAAISNAFVATGNHCFGCTAGAGSSCTGELL